MTDKPYSEMTDEELAAVEEKWLGYFANISDSSFTHSAVKQHDLIKAEIERRCRIGKLAMKIEDSQRGNTNLSRDSRKIKIISFGNENSYWVGHGSDVTAIIAYDENGEMASVPWVAVFKGEFLYSRIPARQLTEIIYEDNHD